MVGIKSVTNARHKLTGQFPRDRAACVTQAGLIKDFGNWGHERKKGTEIKMHLEP